MSVANCSYFILYLTVYRAVSCSVPLLFSPFVLMAKDSLTGEPVPWNDLHRQYIDGSVDGDLPMTRLSEMFNVNHFIVSQVNPHVVPFLPKDAGPSISRRHESHSVPRWLNAVTHLARDEVLHRMTVLSELGIFPTSLTKVVSIVNQRYSGDINIYPEILYANFPRILKNPTTDFMLKACLCGERATWPRFSRIRNHCAIELALDSAIQTMRARVAFSPSQIDLRQNNLTCHSIDSFDSSGGRGRIHPHRRSSYSQDLDRGKRSRFNSYRRQGPDVRQIRNALSFEEPYLLRRQESGTAGRAIGRRADSHQSYFQYVADGPFSIESDSDEVEFSTPERPSPPRHRASWGPSTLDSTSVWSEHHSPVRPRRSSLSSNSQNSSAGTVRRKSIHSVDPSQRYELTAKTVSPPPHHLLQMTPTHQRTV